LSIKNWLKFLSLGPIWGSTFFWIKIGLQEVGPFSVVFYRIFFASIGLVLFFVFTRRKFLLKYWWLYLFLGVFNIVLPFILVSWSETHISSGLASILNSLQPIITALIASLFIREERFTLQRVIGLILGFGGVMILMSNRFTPGSTNQILGILAMIAAIACYGASSVFARVKNSHVKPEDQSLGQTLFGMVLIIPWLLSMESPFTIPVKPLSYLAFAFLGLLGSFYASITWYSLLNEIGPSRVSMITYSFPLVGVALGAIVLHETVDWRLLFGGLLILVGIIIVNSRVKISQELVPIENEQFKG
jgi:drug/metabolite transporter (DMT)-like permease